MWWCPISLISKYTISDVQEDPPTGSKKEVGYRGRGVICREYSEGGNEACFTLTVENHDGSDVSASIAVIWCTPDGDEVLIEMVLVPLHDKLMSTCNQR